jgi:hypothetical protein
MPGVWSDGFAFGDMQLNRYPNPSISVWEWTVLEQMKWSFKNTGATNVAWFDLPSADGQFRVGVGSASQIEIDGTSTRLLCNGQDGIRVESTGTEPKVSFYGVSPVTKPTCPTNTLAEVLAALRSLGLVA